MAKASTCKPGTDEEPCEKKPRRALSAEMPIEQESELAPEARVPSTQVPQIVSALVSTPGQLFKEDWGWLSHVLPLCGSAYYLNFFFYCYSYIKWKFVVLA